MPAAGALKVVDPPESTVPESKLWPSSAVTVCGALSLFDTLTFAPAFFTLRVAGENLKLSIVTAVDAALELPGLGAAPALGLLLPPPHPVAKTAATAAVESRVYVRDLMRTDGRSA